MRGHAARWRLTMKNLFTCVLFLSFASNAFAFIDTAHRNVSYQQESDFPSVCKITIQFPADSDSETPMVGTCTGTLVGPDTIYTAAHCFRKNFDLMVNRVDITCGGQSLGSASDVQIPTGKTWGSDNLTPDALQDFAVVKLLFKTHNAVSAVATGPSLYFDKTSGSLLPGVTCNALGFGHTNLTNPTTFGKLTEATLQADTIISTPSLLIALKPMPGQTLLETRFGEGDSGGPLFCQAPGHETELLGVINANWDGDNHDESQTFESIFNAVYLHPQN
jgi:hypothetical protein